MLVTLRPGTGADREWLAELRAEVLRADLERLGRYDPVRVRQRFRDAFRPEHTRVIVVDAASRGSIAVRPEADAQWIEHFYLAPALQGQGVGREVLTWVLAAADARPFRLNVLRGSQARRLYERHGFTVDSQDAVDVFMSRPGSAR